MYKNAYAVPAPPVPCHVVVIDATKCVGCNLCVKRCRCGVLLPSCTKGAPPTVLYPEECWFCGLCTEDCPTDAIQMNHPLNQRIGFKDKETGTLYRMGRDNHLPPNERPPVE